MNSIDVSQRKAQKQILPVVNGPMHPAHKGDLSIYVKDFLEELGVSSQQFKTLFDNLPQGVALYKTIYDQKSKPKHFILLECNRIYEKIYGITREQIGSCATKFCSQLKNSSVDWVEVYSRVGSSGEPAMVEFSCSDKWYQIYIYSPKKTFFLSFCMDITRQKKRAADELRRQITWEQQLVYTEQRYRRLFQTTQDGIMARDLQGKMLDCNLAYAKMLGYTKKELRNLPVQQLMPEKWLEQRQKIFKKVLQTGRSIISEREYERKDGSVFPASVRSWRITDGKGKVIGVWSIVRDISEQKKLQRSLEAHAGILEKIIDERTKQLKDSERLVAIGQTAGMVGHDLRNPLQTIIGELYLAKSEAESLSDDKSKSNLQESIHVIEEQASYMDKIVSDLQAFVQPVKIDKKLINLKDLISSVLISVAVPDNVSAKFEIKDNFPQIKADLYLLKRVLINLVTNSVQAMPDGGKLTVTGQVKGGGHICVIVQDTGVGIAASIRNQIFTPLFTTKPRGQGFGLAVCKRVIEAHGGTISFESREGKGTKFTIKLPTV